MVVGKMHLCLNYAYIMLDLNQGLTKLKYCHEAMSALISIIPATSSTTISRIRET